MLHLRRKRGMIEESFPGPGKQKKRPHEAGVKLLRQVSIQARNLSSSGTLISNNVPASKLKV